MGDIFLKVDGIAGEAQEAKHEGEIDVISWNWSMALGAMPAPGGGLAAAGRLSIKDLSVNKRIDKATPKLMLSCASAQHIKTAALTVRAVPNAGQTQIEYLKVKMDDVVVTSVGVAETNSGDRGTEVVTLNFRRIALDYSPQNVDGSLGAAISFKWDVSKNVQI
jgi:type VI secretion system secreted protein Hcp